MNINEYILSLLRLAHPHLAEIERQEEQTAGTNPSVGPEVGNLLCLLIRLLNARRVLELGAGLGYSGVWLGTALRETGGNCISIEHNPEFAAMARRNLAAAGLSETMQIVEADAAAWLAKVSGPFDLILQDSAKALYPDLLERCVELTRAGGVLVADDTLFVPMGVDEKFAAPVHRYNELVFADSRLQSTILPIGDGMTISVKLRD